MATDKNLKLKEENEKTFKDILEGIFALYLTRYRSAIRLGEPIPSRTFSLEDIRYSLDRQYSRVQRAFRDRVFTGVDPVNLDDRLEREFDRLMADWRESSVAERAPIISATNNLQAADALESSKKALAAENPGYTLAELSVLAGAALARKFRDRAELIAVMETQAAAESTKYLKGEIVVSITGYAVVRQWNCRFQNSRDAHMSANAQKRPNDQPFLVGSSLMRYPGDVSAPISQTANCHCWLSSTVIPLSRME